MIKNSTSFQKGHNPWNKGKKLKSHSTVHKNKISQTLKRAKIKPPLSYGDDNPSRQLVVRAKNSAMLCMIWECSEYRNKHLGKNNSSYIDGQGVKRSNLKRQRELGFNPLNEPFEGSVAHHINKIDVVYVSEWINKIPHNLNDSNSMAIVNHFAMVEAGLV